MQGDAIEDLVEALAEGCGTQAVAKETFGRCEFICANHHREPEQVPLTLQPKQIHLIHVLQIDWA